MATATVAQSRTDRIAAVLATAPRWTAARRKSDGKSFFYIHGSTAGAVYMTAPDGCTCPAAQRYDGPCKHSSAVAAFVAQRQPAPKARRTYADLYPLCEIAGCREDALRSGRCLDHRPRVAA